MLLRRYLLAIGTVVILVFLFITAYHILRLSFRLDVEDQTAGRSIYVKQLRMVKSGFLVIQKVSIPSGAELIAHTPYVHPQNYIDFYVPLLDGAEELSFGNQLFASLYEDTDGSETFDISIDQQMKNIFGMTTRVNFFVR